MSRRLVSLALIAIVLTSLVAPGVSAQTPEAPPVVPDHMRAFGISPPGQEGVITSTEFASGNYGPHFSDQRELYASLVTDDDITEEELGKYFHSLQFGPGEAIESTYSPIEGVNVFRDDLGIPHIYADTLANAGFALGYVAAEDRLFEMDAFRHAARGTLAELIGPGENDENLEMDIATRREGYTEEEVQKMFDSWDDRFGATGKALQDGLQAYADGVNARIAEVRMSPNECPVEYNALGLPCPPNPEDWTVLDTLYLVILQLRVFGETAGTELQNAGLYAHLTKSLGKKLGKKVYKDLVRQNDRKSATSIAPSDGKFPSQDLGRIKFSSVAIPDEAVKLAQDSAAEQRTVSSVLGRLGFPTAPTSNALLVSGAESKTGNPLEIGAPQVGYAAPSFFMEVDVHVGDNVHYRGPAVPAANSLIPLGRGADYAWSLTTGMSDAVDTRVELLCDPEGGEATKESNGYMFKGKCREMESREETFVARPTPLEPGPPRTETRTFYRTVHGPVFARTTVKKKPVALVKQRFFWKKELDSIAPFYRWNTEVESIEDFKAAAQKFTMSFNSFYADHKDIGYFHVGFYPERTPGTHPSLPTWGTGDWEWRGRLPFSSQPQAINPSTGWVANWNNKPAVGWDSYDGLKFGPIHRVQLLHDKMRALLDGDGKASLSDLVDVIRESATQDTRGLYLGPKMVNWTAQALAGGEAKDAEVLEIVRKWVSEGAHRHNRDDNADAMDDSPALMMFDTWYEMLVHKIFDDELGDQGYDLIGAPVSDYTPEGGSSFWFDFSSYLKNLFSKKTRSAYARNYCDDMTTGKRESCKEQVVGAFQIALEAVRRAEGDDPSAWEKPPENIEFRALGADSVDPIPWQNRGTWNHVVEILSDAQGAAARRRE